MCLMMVQNLIHIYIFTPYFDSYGIKEKQRSRQRED